MSDSENVYMVEIHDSFTDNSVRRAVIAMNKKHARNKAEGQASKFVQPEAKSVEEVASDV